MDSYGPHLLGRVPSPPDERDWTIDDINEFSAQVSEATHTKPTSLVEAFDALQRSPRAAEVTKDWVAFAQPLLAQISPTPPAPTPDPTPTPPPTPTDVEWDDPESVLDQGNYGTCVGNGWAQWGNTLPVDDKFVEADARAIYFEATKIDGQPDDPDAPGGGQQGSTVRSGAKAMKNRSRLTAYAFASNIDDIKSWVRTKGAVVFGTDWTDDMFNPDASGFIAPTGNVAGGHCYVLVGDLPEEDAALFQNSWGAGWGLSGRFKMKWADVEKLLAQNGEACVAAEVA